MHPGHIPRPKSASRRARHGLDFTFVPPKGERRPEMLKQSSVPNLVHDRSEVLRGGDVRRGLREQRASKVASQTQAYDPRDPRPGLRHSSSATSLGRGPGREELRRPMRYDSASSLFHTPDHASFAKSDALQLESRLTQRLREYSFSNIEPTRRPRRKSPSVPREELRPGLFERELRAGRSPYRPGAVSWPEGAYSFHSTATPSKSRASATSSPYPQSTYSQFGGAPTEEGESQLKIYSDLFEEVIERDRVFGPLLRKVKGAYDSLLSQAPQAPSIPAMPAPREERTPGSLRASRSSEPTLRVEAPADAWELHRENQALKDLIERLHMELEEAVKREQRWKAKAAKLKARFSAPVQAQTDYPGQFQGWVPVDERGYVLTDWARQEAEHLEARPQRQVFHANRREPGYEGVDMLNQAHLMSLSSISPQTSQLQPMDQGSARSDDSGILPQRPERRVVTRPASVPKLDLTQMQQLLEEEDYEEAEQEDEDGQYDDEHQPPGAGGLHDESDDGGRPPSE